MFKSLKLHLLCLPLFLKWLYKNVWYLKSLFLCVKMEHRYKHPFPVFEVSYHKNSKIFWTTLFFGGVGWEGRAHRRKLNNTQQCSVEAECFLALYSVPIQPVLKGHMSCWDQTKVCGKQGRCLTSHKALQPTEQTFSFRNRKMRGME